MSDYATSESPSDLNERCYLPSTVSYASSTSLANDVLDQLLEEAYGNHPRDYPEPIYDTPGVK